MKQVYIKSIDIENFRSIKNTGKVEINNKITTLAGKNESGKTTILHALNSFYNDDFKEDDVPVNNLSANPTVKIAFSLNKEYVEEKLNINIENITREEYSLVVTRSKKDIDIVEGDIIKLESNLIYKELENEKIDMSELVDLIRKVLNSSEEDDLDEIIKKSISYTSNNETLNTDLIIKIKDAIKTLDLYNVVEKLMPKIVYFDSFNDMLPDELSEKDFEDEKFREKNKAFIYLLKLLNISQSDFIKKIKGNNRNQSSEFKRISNVITQKYNSAYLQEQVSIGFYKNGDKLFIQIFDKDDQDNDKKPSQRSKGFQWFFSFYLLLNSLSCNDIILIDEPGLYLHAKAQEDIMTFLNNEITNQVIYTTHSPYLIDINKLDSLKLVTKNNKDGTLINSKYYNCNDQDTITPLVTAIGYNVTKSPVGFDNIGLNIITEGISDRFYLLAFLKLMNKKEFNIIPSRGAMNINLLLSMCIGWNLNYLIILDNYKGGQEAKESLKELFINSDEMETKIIKSSTNGCIERNFSDNDKKKFNISSRKKVISSYNFYNKVNNGEIQLNDLDDVTKSNIDSLIKRICQ